MSKSSKDFDLDLDNLPSTELASSQVEEVSNAAADRLKKLIEIPNFPKSLFSLSDSASSAIKDATSSLAKHSKLIDSLPSFNYDALKPKEFKMTLPQPDYTKMREEAEIRKLTLEQLRKGKSSSVVETKQASPQNWYSPKAGTGVIKDKPFKFQKDKNLYGIFSRLVVNSGNLSRDELLQELKLTEKDNNDKTLNNIIINDRVKKIRTRTKLNPTELINNCGNLTLIVEIENRDHLRP